MVPCSHARAYDPPAGCRPHHVMSRWERLLSAATKAHSLTMAWPQHVRQSNESGDAAMAVLMQMAGVGQSEMSALIQSALTAGPDAIRHLGARASPRRRRAVAVPGMPGDGASLQPCVGATAHS